MPMKVLVRITNSPARYFLVEAGDAARRKLTGAIAAGRYEKAIVEAFTAGAAVRELSPRAARDADAELVLTRTAAHWDRCVAG